MTDFIDQTLRARIWDLSQDLPAQLSEAERAELARGLRDLADELSDGGDHPVEVAVIRDLARGVATGDEGRAGRARGLVDNMYRGITEGADRWYELEYVYSRERIEDLEDYTMRRLAQHRQRGRNP